MPEKVHVAEVVEPDGRIPRDLIALRRFAYFMDEAVAIKGTPIKVGFDAVLGLIPGVGDVIGAVLSSWIVIGALRHRVPARVILLMLLNIGIDLVFGAVPVAGDVFDFLYEENVKNLRLLEKHRDRRRPPRSYASIAFVAVLIVLLVVAVAVAMMAGLIALVLWIAGQRSWV